MAQGTEEMQWIRGRGRMTMALETQRSLLTGSTAHTERSISVKHVGIVFGKHGGWLQVSFGSRWLNVQMAFGFWHSTTRPEKILQ